MTLSLFRGCEQRASLIGPRAVVIALANAAGLAWRYCADDRLAAIDHSSEAVLLAATAGYVVERVCSLCASQKRGKCPAHRVPA